jgi:hypothetical protein
MCLEIVLVVGAPSEAWLFSLSVSSANFTLFLYSEVKGSSLVLVVLRRENLAVSGSNEITARNSCGKSASILGAKADFRAVE